MRKRFGLFPLALAALMLGACSSSEDIADVEVGTPQAGWNAEGKGYVNLAINLPTTKSLARGNDDWDDGKEDEYAVNDATLILFTNEGTDGAYVVNSAYALDLKFNLVGTTTDAITSTAKITTEINQIADGITTKALVVLNDNDLLKIEGTDLQVGEQSQKGKTLDELNTAIKSAKTESGHWHNDGFLMSNALLSTAQGGTSDPNSANLVVLTEIASDKIYRTAAEAEANPAADIFVERAESKVTVSAPTTSTEMTEAKIKYQVLGWWLDNTNTTSKLVREENEFDDKGWLSYKNEKANNYRMVGSLPVDTENSLYRVYWGKDFNYDSTDEGDLNTVEEPETLNDVDADAYCFENTTDLAGMVEKNCTRVIVKVQLVDDNGDKLDGFYTIDEDRTQAYTSEDAASHVTARLVKQLDMKAWIAANKKSETTDEITSADFTVTIESDKAGAAKVTAVSIAEGSKSKFNDNATLENFESGTSAVDLANSLIVLNYYPNAEAYYSVWVAHFGNDYTPWSSDAPEGSGNAAGNIYGQNGDNDFLGRYGMLRNNWYQINVTGIRAIGSPTVEPVTDETIDVVETYISFSINILPWAIRKQDIIL